MILKKKLSPYSLLLLSAFVFLASCAHRPTPAPSETSVDLPAAHPGMVKEVESFRLSDPQPPAVADEELDEIPVEINAKVEQWIRYFQGRGRVHMERYLSRSTRYMSLMKRILRENGLPEDLIYIALIESGFNQKATSHAAAVGYWQFIRGTGKRYGLEINALVDERRDPVLATQAAADYYKGLYSIFGSWYLAMAAYNVGENRVQREVIKHRTRDFWELARKRRLPKETMNYVPKFIAAKLIGHNPEKYGFTEVDYEKPIEFELIRIDSPVNLRLFAEKMGLDYDEFKTINPKFRGEIAPTKDNGKLDLRVPLGQTAVAIAAAKECGVDRVEFISDAGETKTYRVRRGDTIRSIARKHNVTVAWLREVNDITGRRLRVGLRLQVPDPNFKPVDKRSVVASKTTPVAEPVPEGTVLAPKVAASQPVRGTNPIAPPVAKTEPVVVAKVESTVKPEVPTPEVKGETKPELKTGETVAQADKNEKKEDVEPAAADRTEIVTEKGVYYVVQSGDTLYSIAQEYDSTVKELMKMNKMKKGRSLKVGAKILVPKDERLPEEPGGEPRVDDKAQKEDNVDTRGENGPDSSINQGNRNSTIARVEGRPLRRPANASGRVHVVKAGENLYRISMKYRTSMKAIQEQNGLRRATDLSVGRRLVIPE